MKVPRYLAVLLIFVCVSGELFAQNGRPDFNRASDYDVQHYVLRVGFDRSKKTINGDTTIRLKPLRDGFRRVVFDSVGIRYSSVTLEQSGSPLAYKTVGGSVIVDLDKAYSAGENVAIRFRYSATPKKGIYFIPEQKAVDDLPARPPQIWTQGQPDEARHWFPSFDFPSDKATVEQFITAPADETVVGNGVLASKAINPDGTATHHFKLEQPFSIYLVSFVIGHHVRVDDKYKEVPLGYYVYRGSENIVPKAFGRTKDMMRIFEELTKIDYPFPKYDQTLAATFSGGMENITATTLSDSDVFLTNNPLFEATVEDLVSHELAHSWFGNLVTCRNWAELWLNEGFATFMEAVYREKKYGRANYLLKVMSDAEQFLASDAVNKKRHGLFNQRAGNVAELFAVPYTTYNKGGVVLHMLREEVGDDAFWKAVNLYLDRHKWANVETTDLKNAMEAASGRKLDWFFDQWVYGVGSPKLTIKSEYSDRLRTLTLTVTQTQKREKLVPAAYRMLLDIEIPTGSLTQTEKIEVSKPAETFSFKVNGKPGKLVIDRNEKIPLKTVKVLPLEEK